MNHYNNQVGLLLRLLPFIAREQIFALHGGSAINLFHFEMPRLSVDIDLTYIPFSDRDNDLSQIQLGLERIKMRLLNAIPGINVHEPLQNQNEYYFLHQTVLISNNYVKPPACRAPLSAG
ncbi:MAG: nucleotidyl transferase AbiEii/AbiGii toxin family protein [Bacteroidales bacterium]